MDGGTADGGPESQAPAPDFERAEYAPGTGSTTGRCEACRGALASSYYQVNGHVVCATCRAQLEAAGGAGLSRRERVIMSTVYGGGAALLGSLVWYAVARITGMELGIIAIGIGLLVGMAVKKGSRARGGRGYQALAMALTYLSIVGSYVPAVVSGFAAKVHEEKVQREEKPPKASAETAEASASAGTPEDGGKPAKPPMNPLLALALFSGFVLGTAIAAPFLSGAGNFMGWIIIGIALYEAWKINRRAPMAILGPFQLAPAEGPPPTDAGPPAP